MKKGRVISDPALRLQQESTTLSFHGRGVFPGEPSHHDTIRDGATPQSIAAVDASGNLPRGIQSGNQRTLPIQEFGFDRYLQSAHGMVNSRPLRHRVKWCLLDL